MVEKENMMKKTVWESYVVATVVATMKSKQEAGDVMSVWPAVTAEQQAYGVETKAACDCGYKFSYKDDGFGPPFCPKCGDYDTYKVGDEVGSWKSLAGVAA